MLYFYSTSNHNLDLIHNIPQKLCYISILHQTTTPRHYYIARHTVVLYFYSTSNHNSPQRIPNAVNVVLYFYSTSNHNGSRLFKTVIKLCYISILHQTTTGTPRTYRLAKLCYISILHQTTTSGGLSVDNAPFMLQIGCPKMCLRDPKKRK